MCLENYHSSSVGIICYAIIAVPDNIKQLGNWEPEKKADGERLQTQTDIVKILLWATVHPKISSSFKASEQFLYILIIAQLDGTAVESSYNIIL